MKQARLLFGLLLALLLVTTGCATYAVPTPKNVRVNLRTTPPQADAVQLVDEYKTDPAAAAKKYESQYLVFKELRVDAVSRAVNNPYVQCGGLRMRPRFMSDLDYLGEGTMISAEGNCQGILFGWVYFNDTWIGVLGGALTAPRTGY
jgi:hypothetical protein